MGANKARAQAAGTSKVGAKPKRTKVDFSQFRFVRIEINEAEKQQFRALLESGEFDPIPLDEWLDRGYKLSISNDSQGSGILASITSVNSDAHDAGLVLTGRGRDAITALAVLCYKDRYLAGEEGWLACESRRGGQYSDIG